VRRRRSPAIAVAIACGAVVLLWGAAGAGADSPTGVVTSSPTSAGATAIVDGFGGNLWFIEPGAAMLGDVTPTGTVSESSTGTFAPGGVSAGVAGTASAGAVWIATGNSDLGSLEALTTPTGTPVLSSGSSALAAYPVAVAADSTGDIWIARGGAADAVDEVVSPYASADISVVYRSARSST
jgi:hypothetical protein